MGSVCNANSIINLAKQNDLGSHLGNSFDNLIAGWTQLGNDIFAPKDLLFIFRRIIDTDRCLKVYDEYTKIMATTDRIRLVGVNLAQKEKNYIEDQTVPNKFKKAESVITWYFVRFHIGNICKSYFTEDCWPQNYWGGLFPKD